MTCFCSIFIIRTGELLTRIHSVKDTFGPEFLIDLILWMYVCVRNSVKSRHKSFFSSPKKSTKVLSLSRRLSARYMYSVICAKMFTSSGMGIEGVSPFHSPPTPKMRSKFLMEKLSSFYPPPKVDLLKLSLSPPLLQKWRVNFTWRIF